MTRPRLLDLFCGAGLAAEGFARAGFEVWGVDLHPMPRYPFPFIQTNALELDQRFLRSFDAIHASPPCQADTALKHAPNAKVHERLIEPTRSMLMASGVPYSIENVPGAPLRNPVVLCGSMFGLGAAGHQLRRHRLFETSFELYQPACKHTSPVIGVYGGHVRNRSAKHGGRGTRDFVDQDKPALARQAMGLTRADLTMDEISQGIPPAFAEYVGLTLLDHLRHARAA